MKLLTLGFLVSVGLVASPALAQGPDCPNGKFRIEIQGCPVASANVHAITIEDLVIDERELTCGDPGYWLRAGLSEKQARQIRRALGCRKYLKERKKAGPSLHRLSVSVFRSLTPDTCLQDWFDASVQAEERRAVSVIACNRDGSEARRWNIIDAFPLRWDPGEYSPSSGVAHEVIEVGGTAISCESVGEAEDPNAGAAAQGSLTPDEMLVVLGFKVTIDNAGSGDDTDTMWETVSGGSLNIECSDSSTGTSQCHATTPGHKYVDTLTLRGPLTPGRQAMCDWINDTVAGKVDQQYRTVVIKEILKDGTEGKTFSYEDSFPTHYVFPDLSSGGTGDLYEEVSFKPIRLNLD